MREGKKLNSVVFGVKEDFGHLNIDKKGESQTKRLGLESKGCFWERFGTVNGIQLRIREVKEPRSVGLEGNLRI